MFEFLKSIFKSYRPKFDKSLDLSKETEHQIMMDILYEQEMAHQIMMQKEHGIMIKDRPYWKEMEDWEKENE